MLPFIFFQGDSQSSRNNTNVDQSFSTSKEQSKDFPAAGNKIRSSFFFFLLSYASGKSSKILSHIGSFSWHNSESQLDERRRNNNQESHNNRVMSSPC